MSRQLAELLLKDRLISEAQLVEADEASKSGQEHIRFLISKNVLVETKLLIYLSKKFSLPSVNISKLKIQPEVLKVIPSEIVKKNNIIPIKLDEKDLMIAVCDPTYISRIEEIKQIKQMKVEVVLTYFSAFDAAFITYYSGGAAYVGAAIESFQKENKAEEAIDIQLVQVHEIDPGSAAQDAPVIQLVNGVLSEAIKRMASDIHVEPYERNFRIRMRIDGILLEITKIPIEMRRSVIARFKIMARMDIAETRVPQDGRIKLKSGGVEIDFRVNSIPTIFGEKIVLRMLSQGSLHLDLLKLGFEQEQLNVFKKGIHSPNGLVLVTGPTGSGKTTTLYSALAELNQVADNISTAEDPVEYNLEGINQVQVHKEIGLTFASVLRSLLRQDPDVILVGEIRDFETAEVAIQAALTGHLVLSTLHTNDAPSTLTRLINMGIEPFLVVDSINTIVAQRLLRTICSACKKGISFPKEKWMEFGYPASDAEKIQCYKGEGCEKCNKTGYLGRIAIYEVMHFTPMLREMILKGESILEIKRQAVKEKMKTLRMSAITKVIEGKTTLEEALTNTMEN